MKKDVVIKVESLSKKYEIGSKKEAYKTLRDQLVSFPKKIFSEKGKKKKNFWALKNISIKIKKGEVVGIIGRNGAGKSTFLKILAKIVEPTSGSITMRGRVASLLEVGTGFNAELSGRENIYLSGAIIGMSRREIEEKFDSIVDFSGIEKFIDTPVKRYSSGMYVRLAFSVAAHLDSDILLVDEVLSVGDAEFQQKCLGKMSALSKSGRTVIFVSHNLKTITEICQKAIFLENGSISSYGEVHNVVQKYLNKVHEANSKPQKSSLSKSVYLISTYAVDSNNKVVTELSFDHEIKIVINYRIINPIKNLQIVSHIWNINRVHVLSSSDVDLNNKLLVKKRSVGKYKAVFTIPKHTLSPNTYQIKVACGIPNTNGIDSLEGPVFTINEKSPYYKKVSSGRRTAIITSPLKWKSNVVK